MRQGNFTNLHKVLVTIMVLGLSAGFIGCSDDDSSPVNVPTTGSVTVDVTPDDIGASWILASADKLVAVVQGDSTLTGLAPGDYTLTWSEVEGWDKPTPAQQVVTLGAGENPHINGVYGKAPGTIIVDVNRDNLDATWTLTGPDGAETTGVGDTVLPRMTVGTYTMTWGDVTDYDTPAVEEQVVTSGKTATFYGVYNVHVPAGFAFVPGGTFVMGSPVSEMGRDSDETPHAVTITNGYLMTQYEVTEAMWDTYMGGSSTSDLPKTGVSWDDAVAFCNAMSVAEGYDPVYTINGSGDVTWDRNANGYRLPTEAEWELACRAGSTVAFPHGDIDALFCDLDEDLDSVGWYCYNSDSAVHPVGQKASNTYGLYDMQGNVWEWCWDAYEADYQTLGSQDPVYDGGATDRRVVRGGSYASGTHFCRAAARSNTVPTLEHAMYGFRVVRTIH